MSDLKNKITELVKNALNQKLKLNKMQKLVYNQAIQNSDLEHLINVAEGNPAAKKALFRSMSYILKHDFGRGQNTISVPKNSMTKLSTKNGPKHDKARFFGIEIECFLPGKAEWEHSYDDSRCDDGECHCEENSGQDNSALRKELKNKFQKAGLQDIEVKDDGSINAEDGYYAAEITFTFSVNNFEKIAKVCKILNDNGAKVNKSCGMHVHIDMRKLSSQTVQDQGHNLVTALPILQRLVPKSRVKNSYCQDNKGKFNQKDRYYAINSKSLSEHNTIEVRLHSATTNPEKITQWVKLLNNITTSAVLNSITHVKTEKMITADFLALLNLDSDTIRYFLKREYIFENENVNCEQITVNELNSQNEAA